MIDRYTKIVLTVIAVSLSLLVLKPLYAPKPAHASDAAIESYLSEIEDEVSRISRGMCMNGKIC